MQVDAVGAVSQPSGDVDDLAAQGDPAGVDAGAAGEVPAARVRLCAMVAQISQALVEVVRFR